MTIYYFAEVDNPRALCEGTKLNAKNLTAAKREASLRKLFNGTFLVLAEESGMSKHGFILDKLSIKTGGKWCDVV
jgi:hypothetical protein